MCLTFCFLNLCDEDRAHVCSPLAALPLWLYFCSRQPECSAVRSRCTANTLKSKWRDTLFFAEQACLSLAPPSFTVPHVSRQSVHHPFIKHQNILKSPFCILTFFIKWILRDVLKKLYVQRLFCCWRGCPLSTGVESLIVSPLETCTSIWKVIMEHKL